MKNAIFCSSDHHANWKCLEGLFEIAKKKKVPFVINGDLIGDYNFEEIVRSLGLLFPYEVSALKVQNCLSNDEIEQISTYQFLEKNNMNFDCILNQVEESQKENVTNQLEDMVDFIESEDFQCKLEDIQEFCEVESKPQISENKLKLRALYKIIVNEHAKLLATLIDKYKVETYFVLGNHEPFDFCSIVKKFLKNKELFFDLTSQKGICEVNGVKICAVSNVKALMPFLNHIYSEKELDSMFFHQRGQEREILFRNVNVESLDEKKCENDIDFQRIVKNSEDICDLDVFFTHGQIGQGAWSKDRKANEMPTLHIAGILSNYAKITVDGHLHTSFEMQSPFSKPLIRAVGNKGYLIKKDSKTNLSYELLDVNFKYNNRGGLEFRDLEVLKKEILKEIFRNE